jgi:hypothetical protein
MIGPLIHLEKSFTSISFPPLRSTIAVISSNGKQVHQKSKTNTQVGHLLTNSCITTVEVDNTNLSRSWSQLIKKLIPTYQEVDPNLSRSWSQLIKKLIPTYQEVDPNLSRSWYQLNKKLITTYQVVISWDQLLDKLGSTSW